MKIAIQNPSTEDCEKTYLTKSVASGAVTLSVKNNNGMKTAGMPLLIGEMGRERSEVKILFGFSGSTSIDTSGTTAFPHDADDPVYALDFDRVQIHRSTSGMAGAYTLLTTVDLDVDNADDITYYDDVNALSTYWYKVRFLNSSTFALSDFGEVFSALGYTRKQLGKIIPQVAKDVGDQDFMYADIDDWINWANEISEDLLTQAKRPYRFLKTKASINVLADATSFPFPDDLWKINYIEVIEYGGASSRIYRTREFASYTAAQAALALNILGADYVDNLAVDDEGHAIIFYPKARVDRINAFTLHYYKNFTEFTSLSNTVETPNSLVYKLGLKEKFYSMRAQDDAKYMTIAAKWGKDYQAEVMKTQREKNVMADGPKGMGPDAKRYPQWGGRRYRQ